MASRLTRTSRTPRVPVISLVCPGCRALRRCKPVGAGTVAGKRRELVECTDSACALVWAPARRHIPAAPPAAA